jgi:acyl dehydratase
MALNPTIIGRGYAPTKSYLISREKIQEFADAIGDPNPAYRDPEAAIAAGYADVIAPPTFAATVIQSAFEIVAADPELGLDCSRMVHGDQTFTYRRPLVAGERIKVIASIADLTTRRGADFLTLRYEVTTADDEPVLTSTALLVFRESEDVA